MTYSEREREFAFAKNRSARFLVSERRLEEVVKVT